MKRVFSLVLIAIFITSCGSLDELLELNVNNDLTESVDVHIPQTQGTAVNYNKTKTVDLSSGSFAEYVGKISAIKINSLTYKIKEFAGNSNGIIQSGSLKFDAILVDEMTNFNIADAATAGTVFSITDAAVLSQIETTLVNNSSVTLNLVGSVLSDAGAMDFKVEVFMNMTATIKE
jgi:PBP1b-binding outer membrane lipoprotein LpoB